MAERERELLSTGEVARLCGVSRDAVLKWIKKGKLPYTRTPGGHYRVLRGACDGMSAGNLPAPEEPRARADAEGQPRDGGNGEPVRCWEYFGDRDQPKEACLGCLVYLARAQNCFRLAELGEESGHRLHFCRHDCRTCAYYRACQGLATEVLIVSKDESMVRRLETRADPRKIAIRVARSGYEASGIVSTFSPALVVLDSDLPQVRNGVLTRSVMDDERIPAARVVIACRKGDASAFEGQPVHLLHAPFTARAIEELAEGIATARGRAPQDVA